MKDRLFVVARFRAKQCVLVTLKFSLLLPNRAPRAAFDARVAAMYHLSLRVCPDVSQISPRYLDRVAETKKRKGNTFQNARRCLRESRSGRRVYVFPADPVVFRGTFLLPAIRRFHGVVPKTMYVG